MATVRAKEFQYAIELEPSGRLTAEGGAPLELAEAWTPEHLVLAGLARCTLQSLKYHARRIGIDLVRSSAAASGRVTKREADERYAFVALACRLEIELAPEPDVQARSELLANAERDCFVGASLTVEPDNTWRVNGVDATPARSS